MCVCVYSTNDLYPKYESSYYLSLIKRHNKNIIIRLLSNYSVSRDLDQYFTKRIQKTNNFQLFFLKKKVEGLCHVKVVRANILSILCRELNFIT